MTSLVPQPEQSWLQVVGWTFALQTIRFFCKPFFVDGYVYRQIQVNESEFFQGLCCTQINFVQWLKLKYTI